MKNNMFHILQKELREMFRDKKSLSMMLIVPLMIPLLVIGMSALFDKESNKKAEDYGKIGFCYELSEVEENLASTMGIEVFQGTLEEIQEKYNQQELDLYITKEDKTYTFHGNAGETTSYASILATSYFNAYKEYLQNEYLTEFGIDASKVQQILTIEEDFVEQENFFTNYITTYAFLFIIMAITISATYPATDATAGEKERGTLETLLTFPIKSRDIIIGKFLSVSLSSIITGLLSLGLTIVSLYFANDMFTLYEGVDLMLSPLALVFASITIIAYSFLISGLCIAIASRSKTFKEAQSALTPITFISFFPGMIAFMIHLETTTVLSLVPFLNFTLLFDDIVSGSVNYLHILLMLISTIVVITIVLFVIIRQYKSEKVLFSH